MPNLDQDWEYTYFHAQNCSWTNGSSSQYRSILPTLGFLSAWTLLVPTMFKKKWVVHTYLKGSAVAHSSNHGDLQRNYGLELHSSVFALTFLSLQTTQKRCGFWRMWEPFLDMLPAMVVHGKGGRRSPGISSSKEHFQSVLHGEKALLRLIILNFV